MRLSSRVIKTFSVCCLCLCKTYL